MWLFGMRDRSFPRWSAPFVGAGLGAYMGFRSADGRPGVGLPLEWAVLLFAVIGLVGGCLVTLVDRPTVESYPDGVEPMDAEGSSGTFPSPESGTLIGRVLVVLSILLCLCPFLGLGLGIVAYSVNRRTTGWVRIACRVALASSLIVTLGILLLIAWEAYFEE